MSVRVMVSVPATTPLSVKTEELVLKRILPNGTVKEVWRANALPVELTFSAIPLPPDPGEAGKATVEGIDIGGGPNGEPNGVRDDIDRYIVFTYPESAKKREALKQGARALNLFMRDREDKAKTWENYDTAEGKWYPCLVHTVKAMGGDTKVSLRIHKEFYVQFLNTKERSRAKNKAYDQMGGYVGSGGRPLSELEMKRKESCTFNPDSLPN